MIFGLFDFAGRRNRKLRQAAEEGDRSKALALISKGADPNLPDPDTGDTPLVLSATGNHPEVAEVLLDAGANLELRPTQGEYAGVTPLFAAAAQGAVEVMALLHQRGASSAFTSAEGRTLMHAVAQDGNTEAVSLLKQWGLSIDAKDDRGATPLIHACRNGNAEVAEALLESGAALESHDGNAYTPLMAAVLEGHDELVRVLLEAGASTDIDPSFGKSLTAMARGARQESTARLLESHKRKLKRKAAKSGQSEITADPSREATDSSQAVESKKGRKKTAPEQRRRNSVLELGVICTSLRYDEYEHGNQLSRIFSRARNEWVKSRNDPESPHYARSCKLLGDWFAVEYRIRSGISMSFGLNEDNEIDRLADVGAVTNSYDSAEMAFGPEPQLKSFEVVAVDFRTHPTHHRLKDEEELGFSPSIGTVAIYQVKPAREIGSSEVLQEFLTNAGSTLSGCFSVQIKDEAIQTVEVDEDGDEFTMTSSTYSGGDIELEVNVLGSGDFKSHLTRKVREANTSPSLIGAEVPVPKQVILLADEERLQRMLDEGLPVDTRVDDETLLKLALMTAATAQMWFDHDDLSDQLQKRFDSVANYRDAIKRMALELLDRGADVNATGGNMPVLALAEFLNDPEILALCRSRASTVDDANSTALMLAAERGDVASLVELLDRGARVNKRFLASGVTPLMMASQGPGGEDEPPLQGEALTQHEAAVRLLIERGARLDAQSDRGDTAIGNAVRRGNVSIVQILLEAGASTTDALPRGQSLIELARQRGHNPLVKLLGEWTRVQGRSTEGHRDTPEEPLEEVPDDSLGGELLSAAFEGDVDRVRSLLGQGTSPLISNEKGVSAFLVPTLIGNAEMQRAFLEAGISANQASANGGVTALMIAAARGSRELCDVLLDAGANIDQQMGSGEPFFSHPNGVDLDMSALGCAIDAQQWDLALHLLAHDAQALFGVMHTDIALTVAKFAPVSLAEALHRAGFSIVMAHQFMMLFAPPLEMQLPQMRSKIVFWAAANPDPAVLPWVLAHGADPLAGNTLGMTPLMIASAVGHTTLVEQLLSDGADPDVRDCDGDTALSLALERGHKAVVATLRKHLAAHDVSDQTPLNLHEAAIQGDLGAVLGWLDRGLSPNLRDEEGCTPLMRAAESGQVAAARLLFAKGASVRPRNARGQSVWDMAQDAQDKRILVSLKEFNADDPKRGDDDERFDPHELSQGRYAHPFKYPKRTP